MFWCWIPPVRIFEVLFETKCFCSLPIFCPLVPWSLLFVEDCQVVLKHRVSGSVEWAQLENSDTVTVSHFINTLKHKTGVGECTDYLFDWSLPIHCPALAKELSIPKYFAGKFTNTGWLHKSWPAPKCAHIPLYTVTHREVLLIITLKLMKASINQFTTWWSGIWYISITSNSRKKIGFYLIV